MKKIIRFAGWMFLIVGLLLKGAIEDGRLICVFACWLE
jgi:hypothetical protein